MSVDSTTPQGNRRIDRVLAEDFLEGLRDLPMSELRTHRLDAEQEEVDLSYIRRMIQGRLDILRAELNRRDGTSTESLVDGLAAIRGAMIDDCSLAGIMKRQGPTWLGLTDRVVSLRASGWRRGHQIHPIELKKTAKIASRTITRKIDWTTAAVVLSPTCSASLATSIPWKQPVSAIMNPKTGALISPTQRSVAGTTSAVR